MKAFKAMMAAAALAIVLCGGAFADTIALWNYSTATGDNPNADIGIGTQTRTADWYESYVSDSGSSDTDPVSQAYSTEGYNGSTGLGVVWMVSTVGFESISLHAEMKRSSTGPATMSWAYTLNGGSTWVDGADIEVSSSTFTQSDLNLASISGAANNANFGFKLTNTVLAGYSTGTMRFDMITVSGTETAVPEPGTVMAFGSILASVGGMAIRRRK